MAKVYPGTGVKMAKLPGVQAELDAAAAKVEANARALAASHVRTGHYSSSFTVENVPGKSGVRDRMVTNTDEAALAIEYGHMTRSSHGKPGRYVPGQFILTRSI